MSDLVRWKQGFTLLTDQTKAWDNETWRENEEREQKMVFTHFTATDQGRGREVVAECRTPERARQIVREHNMLIEIAEFVRDE